MESEAEKLLSDDSSSDVEDIDFEKQSRNQIHVPLMWCDNFLIEWESKTKYLGRDSQLVCYTAVFSVVTRRSLPLLLRGALRDDTKKGCVAD